MGLMCFQLAPEGLCLRQSAQPQARGSFWQREQSVCNTHCSYWDSVKLHGVALPKVAWSDKYL